MASLSDAINISKKEYILIVLGLAIALATGIVSVALKNPYIALFPAIILIFIVYVALLFKEPFLGLITALTYCFFLHFISREIGGNFSYGLVVDALLVLTWISIWYNAPKFDFSLLNNKLVWLTFGWCIWSVLQIANPAGASLTGWLLEIRSVAFYPMLIAPMGLLLLNSEKRINFFIKTIILFSLFAALHGIKQDLIGLTDSEQLFVNNSPTHLLWGKLRVFSVYSNAGQFGPSQAQFSVLCVVLLFAVKNWGKKIILLSLSGIFFYGMLISGTRGALFALIGAAGFAVFLFGNFRMLMIGTIVLAGFLGFLKFTTIGNQSYGIYRLRSSLDPEDASLNVRFINQKKLADYLSAHPFGGGLGAIGAFGHKYNKGTFLASVEPDSYWVKLWAMCGIVGFTLWFCMLMYLLGSSTGIIWKIKKPGLKVKLIGLAAGNMGLFLCSYGNEVMNDMPSLIIIYLSFSVIFLAPGIDKKTLPVETNNQAEN